ncbi:MAG: methionyl-tRNA formyltransferase [Pseudomonadota bacterium]
MRLIFMGTPDFAVPALDALHGAGHEIAAVYTQPPRPAGRGKRTRPSPVEARARALDLDVRTPAALKSEADRAGIVDTVPDAVVVVAYGLLLPQAVLDIAPLGCFNIHASLLPRWRGAAPIHRAVMAGDDRTGICIMRMEAGLDTGPVLLREGTDIGPSDTTGDLHDRLAEMGARLVVRAMEQLDRLSPVAQAEDGVTYAAKIDKSEARVDLSWEAGMLARHINGLSPVPGAWIPRDGSRLKLLRARAVAGDGVPGTRLDAPGLVIATGEGALDLQEVQPAGRGPLSGEEFCNGARLAPGDPMET